MAYYNNIFGLMGRENFTRQELLQIADVCNQEHSLDALYAVIYVSSPKELTERDTQWAKELAKRWKLS